MWNLRIQRWNWIEWTTSIPRSTDGFILECTSMKQPRASKERITRNCLKCQSIIYNMNDLISMFELGVNLMENTFLERLFSILKRTPFKRWGLWNVTSIYFHFITSQFGSFYPYIHIKILFLPISDTSAEKSPILCVICLNLQLVGDVLEFELLELIAAILSSASGRHLLICMYRIRFQKDLKWRIDLSKMSLFCFPSALHDMRP